MIAATVGIGKTSSLARKLSQAAKKAVTVASPCLLSQSRSNPQLKYLPTPVMIRALTDSLLVGYKNITALAAFRKSDCTRSCGLVTNFFMQEVAFRQVHECVEKY